MSSRQFSGRIELVLQPSRRLAAYLVILHITAVVATLVAVMPLAAKALLVLCIAANLIYEFRYRIKMRGPNAIRMLVRREEGVWVLVRNRGEDTEAELLPGGYVQPWLVIAVFRLESGRKQRLLLASDSADTEGLRQLRVLLLQTKTEC